MRETITYALHQDGYYVSRIGNTLAWPILDYSQIGKGGYSIGPLAGDEGPYLYPVGDFRGPMRYELGRASILEVSKTDWLPLKWTRKVPLQAKNWHRQFWGLKPVKQKENPA